MDESLFVVLGLIVIVVFYAVVSISIYREI